MKIVVIGGGAAGFFAAINCAEKMPHAEVILIEKAKAMLAKVRVSGGGRCNVTHSCFDAAMLVKNYPRGGKALLGPFHRFQPQDTIQWFLQKGVRLKTEADGRMFPVTNTSETIIQCFLQAAKKANVIIKNECALEGIKKEKDVFLLGLNDGSQIVCDKVLVATGSNTKMYDLLKEMGHTIIKPVPSLFTFPVDDKELHALSGVSVPEAHLKFEEISNEQVGPLLITHWGFSGPAALKLSAWAARDLFEKNYKATLIVNWMNMKEATVKDALLKIKKEKGANQIGAESLLTLPKSVWRYLIKKSNVDDTKVWSSISSKEVQNLTDSLFRSKYQVTGKTTNKEEFVTAGGVDLKEVDFRTMESKLVKGLFFAGEILDIDGITGGFNFQNAWTTAWIASEGMQ